MLIQISATDSELNVRMTGELNIYNAAELRQRCMEILLRAGKGSSANIDMSDVSEIDGAGIQLLVLLKRELNALGVTPKITAWSESVAQTFDFVGIPEFLSNDSVWVE